MSLKNLHIGAIDVRVRGVGIGIGPISIAIVARSVISGRSSVVGVRNGTAHAWGGNNRRQRLGCQSNDD